ncbi:hypothetical protein L198_01580 [Cryptococcus wingfieldii CBS 7118]|uniref:Uncharacterized protein n=1 Tax=Cryptococcus wingfieldii CBS 7118 TaxID=1295528 RepID=A0A1E3JZM8_9TREE|nr:hypothetical protein L198_01580 [Cryptococcus wingfieldii CBS 7118]ODO06348.1 hypothetical protein L198_01580 [Cryptococcus wingfieldii CBS 7118]
MTTAAPHTPPAQHNDADLDGKPQVLKPSPTHSIDYKDAAESPEVLEKTRRKYSLGLYHWTRDMWEHARQDVARRSSVSSTESDVPSPRKHQRSYNSDVGKDVGAVPAYH